MILAISLLLFACSKDEKTEQVTAPEDDDGKIELTEEEAIAVLEEYEMVFTDIIDDVQEDNELQQYSSIDEVKEDLLIVMSEELADQTVDQYFREEEDKIYVEEADKPFWFDEDLDYQFEQTDDQEYEMHQQQETSAAKLMEVTYVINWEEEKWRLTDLRHEEQQEDEDTSNSNADEQPSDKSSSDQNADETSNESDQESTDSDDDQSSNNGDNTQAEDGKDQSDAANTPTDNDNTDEEDTMDNDDAGNETPSISEEKAVELVKQHLNITDGSAMNVVVDHVDENGNYVVQVYEVVDNGDVGHTATLGWYIVNQAEGTIQEM